MEKVFDAVRPSSLFAAAFCFWLLLVPLNYKNGHHGVGSVGANCQQAKENVFSARLRELTCPGDRLLIWGWRNSYFVETGLLQGSRWMYPQFAVGPYASKGVVLNQYVEDLDSLRPEVIVDWVGDDALYFKGPLAVRIESIPELSRRLAADYELIAVEGNQKLYRRRKLSPETQ